MSNIFKLYLYSKVKSNKSKDKIYNLLYDENDITPKTLYQFTNLIRLQFNDKFNKSIKDCIPTTVTSLVFGESFNQPLMNINNDSTVYYYIPLSLECLILSGDFNQEFLAPLPDSLKYLGLLGIFNKPLSYIDCYGNKKPVIPNNLINLHLGSCFNQNIQNCLPYNLKFLHLGKNFNQPLKYFDINILPDNLKYLRLGYCFNQDLNNCLPQNLVKLSLSSKPINFDHQCLPKSIRTLHFCGSFNNHDNIKDCISDTVTHVIFGPFFNKNITGQIPDNVTHLTFGKKFTQSLICIPNFITHLNLHENFNINPDEVFTILPSLECLKIGAKKYYK